MRSFIIIFTLISATTAKSYNAIIQAYELDLLGLVDHPNHFKRDTSLQNSASKFLLEIYNEIKDDEELEFKAFGSRSKRSLRDDNFITDLDRLEIEKSNNILTFGSKKSNSELLTANTTLPKHTKLNFNTNDIPSDLQLVYSALRIYQDPALGKYHNQLMHRTTISLYHLHYNRQQQTSQFRLLTELNSTTSFKGWLEFNTTRLLDKWIHSKTTQETIFGNDILVSVTLGSATNVIDGGDIGLISAISNKSIELQPFVVGYFNGPELITKLKNSRLKREVGKQKNLPYMRRGPPRFQESYQHPKTCERFNFTVDFRDFTQNVIAPTKFDAFFCGGECNFPLGSSLNATNHAIVQTLVHLKINPNVPKPYCVPTAYGNLLILEYFNDNGFNLKTYKQSVAKQCGCH